MGNTLPAQKSEITLSHGIFRINTDISSGDQNIETVVTYAKDAGVDYIVISDQFLVYAKYGLPPFREVFAYSMDQKSIVSYGIEKYLARIENADHKNPELAVIPGADIAPHYYWSGTPFTESFTANQFSEQITIFGPKNVEFYKNLPVIHNEPVGFFFPGSLLSLLPLLITLAGISLFIKHKRSYKDRQGNRYKVPGVMRFKILAFIMMMTGLLWTWNNRPFHKKFPLSQYSQSNRREYQQTFDYIRKAGNDSTGVYWAAPEAAMYENRKYAKLVSIPFIDDIKHTYGYNGFAGIYGDVSSAHEPGSFWDDILLEYCEGKRKFLPVIVGERDWHGRGNLSIDLIKTVTVFRKQKEKPSQKQIINAIIGGSSYAVVKIQKKEVVLSDIRLSNDKNEFVLPGETLKKGDGKCILKVSGKLVGKSVSPGNNPGKLIVVVDGKELISEELELSSFDFSTPIVLGKNEADKSYVRFYIMVHSTPRLICNPFLIEE